MAVQVLTSIKTHHHGPTVLRRRRPRHFLHSSMEQSKKTESSYAVDPPPFDPLAPAVPISYPLKSLDELESRVYFKSFHFPFNQAAVKLPAGGKDPLPQRPRILVCHDMQGGYIDDRFVLGTFIMEGDEGTLNINKVLSTKTSAQMYAERLTELAVALGFDGWLENFPKLSADVAGDRKYDVYMGIDVFGRGTYGGGEWMTNVALDVIKKYDVSAAIFAPGWVYETKQPPNFQTAQNRLIFILFTVIVMHFCFKEASYSGGGNITFRGTLGNNPEFTARLFQGELLFGNFPVHFTYSVKSSGNSLLGLALQSSNATNEKRSIFLAASRSTLLTMNQFSSQFTKVIMPHRVTELEAEPGWIMQESSINMKGHILREIWAVCYSSKPRKSVVAADDKNHYHGPSEYYAILGDIKVTSSGDNTKFPPSTSWLVDGQFVSWTSGPNGSKLLSVKISWKLKDGNADLFTKYNIYVSKLTNKLSGNHRELVEGGQDYIGVAVVNSFYISKLEVPSGISSLKFVIQVCGLDGGCQKLEDSPFFLLQSTRLIPLPTLLLQQAIIYQ
ncbi:hypothetical protein DH2020_044244 [Rehmannia glutinosa]|uniref:mannosyl-glycoprotein endo-beta-N-acetylglucosaminidase n=1 Tax=Rehmannia glutinosa TaxID=99300 RepID=A0ABR0UHG6_REHGL